MKTVIVYESMYGSTHEIATHIADVARSHGEVVCVAVSHADDHTLDGADLAIVGGPTHMHGMSRPSTRKAAIEDATSKDSADPDAPGQGLRDWFEALSDHPGLASVAFDTRMDAKPTFTGRASKGISRRLRHHGMREVFEPESFLVDKESHLLPGEAQRAELWAARLFDTAA